ncbi:ribose 5-phosphate isomerase B [Dyadobacter soli]|uniref:Ribose 5-phosphate isomerase B n=2 Tax=Dyadobacter soli TaxID=659014 RepID=A0A1G7HJY4_9BACT|nr:ribose 5-phosphate isomerase B [Dyadobacter soli]
MSAVVNERWTVINKKVMRKIAIGSDHAGFPYKQPVIDWLTTNGFDVKDFGTYSADSADYADFAHPVASGVESKEFEKGVLLCGSGQGVCITANKHQGVRAALVWDLPLAPLARQHNDANVICFPVRFIELETALASLEAFLSTEFEGGRHQTRVDKISC